MVTDDTLINRLIGWLQNEPELVVVVFLFGFLLAALMIWLMQKKSTSQTNKDEYLSRLLSIEPEQAKQEDKEHIPPKKQSIQLNFLDDQPIRGHSQQTILANSLKKGVAIIHNCGGNARCSTCRVYIVEGLENCCQRNPAESALAEKKGLEAPIRLACQTRASGDITLKRLVYDKEDSKEAGRQKIITGSSGKEMNLAILFCDIRSFTPFTEKNLPYDVVHMLNKYFNFIGQAIDDHFGFIDKYMGDGIMALFGLNQQRSQQTHPCLDASRAAIDMQKSLQPLNQYLNRHFQHQFQIGIGIHFGSVIVGNMGFHKKMQFTALGDSVNLAARIEGKTKELQTGILVSEEVKKNLVDSEITIGEAFQSQIKGKTGSYCLYTIPYC